MCIWWYSTEIHLFIMSKTMNRPVNLRRLRGVLVLAATHNVKLLEKRQSKSWN